MTKYANWAELSDEAPTNYDDNTTEDAYSDGLERVAPPGMKPKAARAANYATGTNDKGGKWLNNWKTAEYEEE